MTIRVLLVDDDAMATRAVELILEPVEDIRVVGVVRDGDEVVEAVHLHHPDVVLMDVRMDRVDGVTATRNVLRLPNPPKIIVLTTFDLDEILLRAIEAGAHGFLLKTASPPRIVEAIREAAGDKGMPLSPVSAQQLVEHMKRDEAAAGRREALRLVEALTDKEREVVALVARGRSNAEVAKGLFVSEATVKTHLSAAQHKLGAANRVDVAVTAARAGLV